MNNWDDKYLSSVDDGGNPHRLTGESYYRVQMKYEDQVRKICGESWKTVSDQERQGGFAVACMIAYMRGVKPALPDVAKHLGVTADEINVPFVRLLRNGAFHRDKWNAKNDPALLGDNGEDEAHRVWGFVAAVGSGFLGAPC